MFLSGCVTTADQQPVWPYPVPPSTTPGEATPPSYPTQPPQAPTEPTDPRAPFPPPADPIPPVTIPSADPRDASGPAVVALLDQAEAQYKAGEFDQAAASLERGLRIEPKNPLLWHRLAITRAEQGEYNQAEELAQKSTSLARRYPLLQARNWRFIGEIRRLRGNVSGAAEARRRADEIDPQ